MPSPLGRRQRDLAAAIADAAQLVSDKQVTCMVAQTELDAARGRKARLEKELAELDGMTTKSQDVEHKAKEVASREMTAAERSTDIAGVKSVIDAADDASQLFEETTEPDAKKSRASEGKGKGKGKTHEFYDFAAAPPGILEQIPDGSGSEQDISGWKWHIYCRSCKGKGRRRHSKWLGKSFIAYSSQCFGGQVDCFCGEAMQCIGSLVRRW